MGVVHDFPSPQMVFGSVFARISKQQAYADPSTGKGAQGLVPLSKFR